MILAMLLLLAADLPTASLTPGLANPAVTQANIMETICVPGWTKTVRPPASYTDKLKRSQIKARKLPGKAADYELDHLIALELGGDPRSPLNLWPQAWVGTWNAHLKDRLENQLHGKVCTGDMTLAEAQHAIATDWIATYQKMQRDFGHPSEPLP
ncbi:MAG TPA: hypothetical protein DEQ40_19145 [Oxalobacteraceae bacterium]|nr:hypothetical protein [Oxalobacteraceae bacterium]